MTPDQMRAFARERVEALFNRGELDRIPEFVTDDFVNHEAWEGEDPGVEGFRIRMRRLHDAFSGLHMDVHEMIAEGDLVAYRAELSGVHSGELLGIPPTGRPFHAQQMHMLRVRDGRASEHWATRDDLGMLLQLGVVSPPGTE
ncbi:MAG: ester cyclase [Thermoleophilia bacterium]|nr:ester cyclase [Thermoleophilia bacterium]